MKIITTWLLIKWLIIGISLFYLPIILPTISVATYSTALIFALVLTILNYTVRPVLYILTLPINIITLGLFSLILNTIIFSLAAYIIEGVKVNGFFTALLGAIFVSLVSQLIDFVFRPSNKA